jgi:hypothetical protein
MVQVERVLQRQLPIAVRILHACVLDNVDGLGWPAGGDIAHYTLQEHWPLASEADEERWHVREAVFAMKAGLRDIIDGYGRRRDSRGGEKGERVGNGRYGEGWCWFVYWRRVSIGWACVDFLVLATATTTVTDTTTATAVNGRYGLEEIARLPGFVVESYEEKNERDKADWKTDGTESPRGSHQGNRH